MHFSEEDRRIYAYHNGTSEVRADPLVIRRRLIQNANGKLDQLVREARGEGASLEVIDERLPRPELSDAILLQEEAQERLVAVIRRAFELPPLDPATGQGCTEAMVWKVWGSFNEFLEGESRPVGN